MESKLYDKILDQLIDESIPVYFEKEVAKNVKVKDVKFSETHEEKIKKLINGVKKEERRVATLRITKKVAIIVVGALMIMAGLVTTVEAWRKEVMKFIMKNNSDNYMSISFGDNETLEELDEKANTYTTDEIQFLYLPDGFEFVKNEEFEHTSKFDFENKEKYITFKKVINDHHLFEKGSDIEKTFNEKIELSDKEVFKTIKENNRINYIWYDREFVYEVISNIEEEAILKFIENIKNLKKI